MENKDEILKQFQEQLKNCKSINDLFGDDSPFQKLKKHTIETMLEAEITEQLGYGKHDRKNKQTSNSRNGKSSKTLKTKDGELEIEVPRDRQGDFEPIVIGKHQKDIGLIEEKIISMYAKGMSARDITEHIREIYGIDLSATYISNATDKVLHLVREWQDRPLEPIYAIVYLDAIFFKVKENHAVQNKAAYTCLAIDMYGKKELLGIWIAETEGANFWLAVLTELRNRGVKDILRRSERVSGCHCQHISADTSAELYHSSNQELIALHSREKQERVHARLKAGVQSAERGIRDSGAEKP